MIQLQMNNSVNRNTLESIVVSARGGSELERKWEADSMQIKVCPC